MISTTDKSYLPVVLVVDDDDTTCMMAGQFLAQAGFSVETVSSGAGALACVDDLTPDLIVLDVEMPEMDGFEVCRCLRKMPKYKHTPVMMLTGLNNSESIDIAYEAGATDFATKPINWSLLSHRLRYIYRASQSAEQLARSRTSLASAQRIAKIGNWEFDCGREQMMWSEQLYRTFGVQPGEVTPSVATIVSFVDDIDRDRVRFWMDQHSVKENDSTIDHLISLPDGTSRYVRQQVERSFDSDGKLELIQATVQDFTERRLSERKIHQLAYYDTLTGLANRRLFQGRLEAAIESADKNDKKIAVLYFDLDDFKRINDTFGHAMGDHLLKGVSVRLAEELNIDGQNGTLARMGGDEFTLLLENTQHDEAVAVGEKLIEILSRPFQLDASQMFTTVSVGLAMYPDDGMNSEALMKHADIAMYEAKRSGKNTCKSHDPERDAQIQRRNLLSAQMRVSLEEREFSVHYQPLIDLKNGAVFSVEALVRWNSTAFGVVGPDEFIPLAEENGLIIALGEYVLRTACTDLKSWLDAGHNIPGIAVNISVLQFMQPMFTELVSDVLSEVGLAPGNLELEITESLLAADTNMAVSTLRKLKDIGVRLSIDDFGTGYSSLSQLKNFPIDRIKIDRSFISNITGSLEDAAIARAVIAMADSMHLRVLAEGVENLEQLDYLREHNCDEIQGYFFSKPLSAEKLIAGLPELNVRLEELFGILPEAELKRA